MLGKVLEITVKNCCHSLLLTEVENGIKLENCEALTLVAGGSVLPVVKVEDSLSISVIGHTNAMRNPLELYSSTGVSLFAINSVSPSATPE